MKKNCNIPLKCLLMIFFFLQVGTVGLLAQVEGEFPYFESFLSGQKPAGIETPDPGGDMGNSVEFKNNGVQLTPPELDKFGAIYLDNHQFQSNIGIFISFEYMVYDGNGGDGFSLFFFDANEEDPGIGAPGSGIGYTYNRSINTSENLKFRFPGLKGGYLGIAFDSYGSFKELRYQGESRVSGIPFSKSVRGTGATVGADGNNEVTLRGAMSPTAIRTSGGNLIPGMGVRYGGYPVLVTQRTTENVGFRLRTSSYYVWERYDQFKGKSFFQLRGGTEFKKPSDPGYRKAFVELFPIENKKGFLVSVMIQQGEASRDTIIYDYEYTEAFDYVENAITNSSGDNYLGDDILFESPVRRLIATVPKAFKIGFAAATGASKMPEAKRDRHVIKNLNVILPRAAKANDDFVDDIPQRTRATIYPLPNDFGYKGPISRNQAPCPECIDKTTFRFLKEDGTVSPTPFEYTVSGEGTWRYDQNTGIATFDPVSAFVGVAQVKYDIKGGIGDADPYALEPYRSGPATIRVNVISSANPEMHIISNKMVTGKFKK